MRFSGSLATKLVYLNSKPFMIKTTLNDLNPIEFSYYPFMISLDKHNKISNAFDDLSLKICVPSKTIGVNIKVFNLITNINEVENFVKYISYDSKCKLDSRKFNSNRK